ncbi:hypothetical protein [Streptomyces sp. CA-253872]|uniref:hypothetical protein n=1 Tax=Streptomyces sp. CA-253872 TaxID=3240067 RepID=UPI003D91EEFE
MALGGVEVLHVTRDPVAGGLPTQHARLRDGATEGFVLIDTGNDYPQRDGRIAQIEDESLTESRWTERQLGHPVVKVFNATYAQDLLDKPRPAGADEVVAALAAATPERPAQFRA